MNIRRVKSMQELLECIEISKTYLEDNPDVFEINEVYARQEIYKMYKHNDYFFIITDNSDCIQGWVTAVRAPLFYWSPTVSLNLIIFHNRIKSPIKSVKMLKEVFNHMVGYAKSRKILVIKANSMLDTNSTFNKVLISMGWVPHGDMLIFDTRKDE